jgi:hypothetical protein
LGAPWLVYSEVPSFWATPIRYQACSRKGNRVANSGIAIRS